MKGRVFDTEVLSQNRAAAVAKVRIWKDRADKARQAGRNADAARCDDKVRDWASKLKQIERVQQSGTQSP